MMKNVVLSVIVVFTLPYFLRQILFNQIYRYPGFISVPWLTLAANWTGYQGRQPETVR